MPLQVRQVNRSVQWGYRPAPAAGHTAAGRSKAVEPKQRRSRRTHRARPESVYALWIPFREKGRFLRGYSSIGGFRLVPCGNRTAEGERRAIGARSGAIKMRKSPQPEEGTRQVVAVVRNRGEGAMNPDKAHRFTIAFIVKGWALGSLTCGNALKDAAVVGRERLPHSAFLGDSVRPVHQVQVIAFPHLGVVAPTRGCDRDNTVVRAFGPADDLVW